MFERIQASIELTKASLQVLRKDKQLVIFPLLSTLALLLVLVSFAVPVLALTNFGALFSESESAAPTGIESNVVHYAILFAFYFVNFFVISFFNAALIACAINHFNGEETSVGTGLRIAASRLPQIIGWSLVAATVGVLLRFISERSGIIGRIVIGMIGFVWAVATYFVLPVIVVKGAAPHEAIRQSAGIIRKTWGEAAISYVGVGVLTFVLTVLSLIPMVIGIVLAIGQDSAIPAVIGVATTIVLLIAVALVSSTLKVILVAALYRYASTGLIPEHFDGSLLRQMIRTKTRQ